MSVSNTVMVANWLAFLSLTSSFIFLLVFSLKYKGPTGKEAYYNGFREQNMLGVFINLFCAVAFFAKVVASHSGHDGFVIFTTLRYVDYLTQCPLLTIDLLSNLEAPYKFSCGALVLVCLTFAIAADSQPKPDRYVWFGTGLSFFIFSYSFILSIVKERLAFFASCARDSHAKKSIMYLKIALFSYFGVWIFFPLLWFISPMAIGLISLDTQHVFHCILDVIAKSMYGFALLYFRVFFDRKLIAAGVDEEEFHKFSKDTTTGKLRDSIDEGEHEGHKKKEIHLPHAASVQGDSSSESDDLESGNMEILRNMSRRRSQTSYEGNGRPMTSFSSRQSNKTSSPTRFSHSPGKKGRGHKSKSRGSDGGTPGSDRIYALSAYQHDQVPDLDDSVMVHNGRFGAGLEPDESEDEASFMERARQQYELHRSRSRLRHLGGGVGSP